MPTKATQPKPEAKPTTPAAEAPAAEAPKEPNVFEYLSRIADATEDTHATLLIVEQIIGDLFQTVDRLAAQIESLTEAQQPAPQPAPIASQPQEAQQPAAQVEGFQDFTAHTLSVSIDEAGQRRYKILGAAFGKFGVRVWPEILPILGITHPEALPVGPNTFAAQVRAELKDNGQPRKIIGLAPGAPPPAVLPEAMQQPTPAAPAPQQPARQQRQQQPQTPPPPPPFPRDEDYPFEF